MKISRALLICVSLLLLQTGYAQSAQFRIGIMQDQMDGAVKYQPLVQYFKKNGIDIAFIPAPTYPVAANMFRTGHVDAMFSGSAVAGIMIIKDLARPLARPLGSDGSSTYSAVVLAQKGSPAFDGSAEYFNQKRVVFCPLASSGEVFYHSIENVSSAKATLIKAASHGGAIETLARGFADIAIVKNRIWDKVKQKYPGLAVVGIDNAENPDNTLIVSKKADQQIVSKVSDLLLSLKNDKSSEAERVREQLEIRGYIKTTEADFKHTFKLLKRAGVDKSFNFAFNITPK